MKILSVCFGGEWDCEGQYAGNVSFKAVVIKEHVTLKELTTTITKRCNIAPGEKELILSHLNPFQTISHPYTVENDDDLMSFLEINASLEVRWKMPLYVTLAMKKSTIDYRLEHATTGDRLLIPGNEYEDMPENADDRLFLGDEDMPKIAEPITMMANNDFLRVGQLYPSKKELKSAVEKQALRDRFGYRVDKSNTKVYRMKCVDKGCSWLMMASKVSVADYFQIKKYTYKHTCSFYTRFQHYRKPSYITVAEQIKTR